MAHVSIHYRIYLGAAHHRRPRNPQPWVEPYPSSEVDVATGGAITPFAPPTLPYTPPGGPTAEPAFLFWSIYDGTSGQTQTTQALSETVGAAPLTLIAWYYLPGGGPNGTDTAILIDAYSVRRGDFVDDDFVDVTSDPSLTLAANVDGSVPTSVDEEIQARPGIPTGEGFDMWVVSAGGASASGQTLTAPAKSGGLAIATYDDKKTQLPNVNTPREGLIVLYGVVNDASGLVLLLGGGGPRPVGPLGPLVDRLVSALGFYSAAAPLSGDARKQAQEIATNEIGAAAQDIADSARKGFAP